MEIDTLPKARLLTPNKIMRLAEKHSADPFSARDSAIIALAGMAYFTGHDLSLVEVQDLVDEKGHLIEVGRLPVEYNLSGKAKLFHIPKGSYLRKSLIEYMEYRKLHGMQTIRLGIFNGLNPESKLILKSDAEPYSLNYKHQYQGDKSQQPLQMQRQFQKYFLGEGVSLKSLNDSFIINFYQARCQTGTAQTIRDLIELTGMTADTLRSKCIKNESSIRETLEMLYK